MPPRQREDREGLVAEELPQSIESIGDVKGKWKLRAYLGFLLFDIVTSIVLLSPAFSRYEYRFRHYDVSVLAIHLLISFCLLRIVSLEDRSTDHYTLHGSLCDLLLVAIPRILSALFAIFVSFSRTNPPLESPFQLYHENGYKKSTAELEEEALSEPFAPKIRRFLSRPAFTCESLCFLTGVLDMIKCLARLNVEIGVLRDSEPQHPVFWIALAMATICSLVEATFLATTETVAFEWGRARRSGLQERGESGGWIDRVGQKLAQPLLSDNNDVGGGEHDEEQGRGTQNGNRVRDRVSSDIGGDANYKASFSDLFRVCASDVHLIAFASVFLLLAAVCTTLVPHYTGKILDALVAHSSDNNPDPGLDDDGSGILHIPGFVSNIEKLVAVSILGGIFAGIRGSIFSLVGARVNVRLRVRLLDSVLSQDISFFEMTRTGDLTSRLSSDTTLVGSQMTTNVNIFLRSIVRAVGVLIFMCLISWRLSLLAFITIPVVSVLSKWYGRFVRRLSKLQQKKVSIVIRTLV